jgi:hypothetical protein
MTTGTSGDDVLTNDPGVQHETVDAKEGNDRITIVDPNGSATSGTAFDVTALGGSSNDVLVVEDRMFSAMSGGGFGGTLRIRTGVGAAYQVTWSSIERLETRSAPAAAATSSRAASAPTP